MTGINGLGGQLGQPRFGRIADRVLSESAPRDFSAERLRLGDFASQLRGVGRELDTLRGVLDGARLSSSRRGRAQTSSSPIGIDTSTTNAVARSGAEINTATTSYASSSVSFSGLSTATAAVSGTYDGSLGDQILSLTVVEGGEVGTPGTRTFELREADGTLVETLNATVDGITGEDLVSTSVGIEFRFAGGVLVEQSAASLEVSSTVAPTVDPTAAFDGSGATVPGFDTEVSVGEGSFTLAGQAIEVFAGDSIDTVLARINGSGADVTASFDAAAERVVLTANTAGANADLSLASDTSGFLAAVKLDAPEVTAGTDDQRDQTLDQVAEFASVVSGSFEVNGASISVDPAVDSLNDVLERIENSSAGVSASFDAATGRIVIESETKGEDLVIASDSSGFLSATGLEEETYLGEQGRSRVRGLDRRRLQSTLESLFEGLTSLLVESESGNVRVEQSRLRSDLRSRIDDVFLAAPDGAREDEGGLSTSLGLFLGLGAETEEEEIAVLDARALETAIRREPEAFLTFFDDEGEEGSSFITTLEAVIREAEVGFGERFGPGAIVDRSF